MQIEQWFSTDDFMGPPCKTYEEAQRVTAEHGLRGQISEWFTVGNSGVNTFATRAEAVSYAAYVRSMSMGG